MNQPSDIAPDRPDFSPRPLPFPVVGVGASAGGLEAFESFLTAIDPDYEAAYVLVQHLDPNHESLLTELLARHAPLPVSQIADGTEVEPRRIYVIPSASGLTIEDGVLGLVAFEEPRGFRKPIDDFFQALAIDQGANAVAVVLSGTGGDGTVGIRHVKETGGLAIAQDPDEAAYDGMPSSAISTGLVDHVLAVPRMPDAISAFFQARAEQPSDGSYDRERFIEAVIDAVRERTGHDFGHYKIATVLRRIQRRMQVLELASPHQYVRVLAEDPAEADALFQDLLINVTSFFRDPEVFDLLRREVIPSILKASGRDLPVRVWVPGCSSGEEAYSLAILFAEGARRMSPTPEIQIFATDIDEEMLARARAGRYPRASVADMPPELLARHFVAHEDGYVVTQAIRDMVRVSAHSVIKDPPFSRLDLVSCRNLLIYFDARLQSRVLPLFHYALRPEGWLVLGSAENLAGRDDLFDPVSREERVFRKLARASSNFVLPLDTRQRAGGPREQKRAAASETRAAREERITRRLMDRYVLPHVVVGPTGIVTHASARTAPYLHLSVGAPSMRLLDVAPSDLRPALRSIMTALEERRRRVIRRGVELSVDLAETVTLDIVADPIDGDETMIVFRETSRRDADDDDVDADVGDFSTEQRIAELEDELGEARTRLRTTVEELETSNEELKSSNEEMMSMNEELQSANEELSTVNEELKSKLDELAEMNADQANFFESTRVATLFVDAKMRMRGFTPEAADLFGIHEHDKGRAVTDLRTGIEAAALSDALAEALAGRPAPERQVTIRGGTHTMRALPYIDREGDTDGAVLVLEDVTQLVRSQTAALSSDRDAAIAHAEIERLYESAPIGMAVIDRERRYARINPSLAAYNGISVEEHLGRTIAEMLPEIGERIEPLLTQVFESGESVSRAELVAHDPEDGSRPETFELDVYPLSDDAGTVDRVGIIVHRVTEARRLEADLRHLMAELQHRVKNSLATVVSIVRQSARATKDHGDLEQALTGRIGALAATHSLLTASDWGAVPVGDIVAQELAPYDAARVSMSGPSMGIGAKAAVTLTLVLHELATNAAKYGALHGEEGHLEVKWSRGAEGFRLEWHERPAHAIDAPSKMGFGLRFIERIVAHDLDGTAEMTWDAGGLHAILRAPLPRVAVGADHA